MRDKKDLSIYISLAVAFFVIGGIVGSKIENYRMNKPRTEESTKAPEKDTENTASAGAEEAEEEVLENIEKTSYVKMNEIEKFQGIDLKVLNVKESQSISNESGKTKATGKFIIIELSMKNTSKEAVQYGSDDFHLITNGIKYEIDDNAFDSMGKLNSQKTIYDDDKSYIGVYDNFNPGMTKKTYIVFEVPKEVNIKDTKLIVGGNEQRQFNLNK